MSFKKRIGERIKSLREGKGHSLREAAKRLDINHSTLGKIENGINYPSIDLLFKIAECYDTDPTSLLGERAKIDIPEKYSDYIILAEKVESLDSDIDKIKTFVKFIKEKEKK